MDCPVQWDVVMEIFGVLLGLVNNDGRHEELPTISDELQQVLYGVGRRDANNTITPESALRYAHRVIASVNKEEDNADGHKRNKRTGIIKVSGLSHKRAKQCGPSLAW